MPTKFFRREENETTFLKEKKVLVGRGLGLVLRVEDVRKRCPLALGRELGLVEKVSGSVSE